MIVQHAEAAEYIINKLCIDGEDFTEDLILETHRILTCKVDSEDVPWSKHSGIYRSDDVSAGLYTFISLEEIPDKMKEMIRQYNSNLDKAIHAGPIDPIMLAAKYSHIFVNINPFLDGNGRMARLILNSNLMKFGMLSVYLGKTERVCCIYKVVVSSASHIEDVYDNGREEEAPVTYKELASFDLACSQKQLGKLVKAVLP